MSGRIHAQRRSREQRVGDILLAARHVFCEKGYEPTTVSEIAESIGVVEGTVYKYFTSKRELLLHVLEHWYTEMFGDYARDIAKPMNAKKKLYTLIYRHIYSIKQYPLLCRLMFNEVRSERDYHGSKLHQQNRQYTELMMRVIQEGIDEGSFKSDLPVALLRHIIYGGIEHQCWNYMWGRGELNPEKIAEQITDLICNGLSVTQQSVVATKQKSKLKK